MLRKALDLWSAEYRDRHGMHFDSASGESNNLYWRLRKIAEENKLYQESIHSVIDALRLDANEAVHDPSVCSGGRAGTYDGGALMSIQGSFVQLHAVVVNLITTTMPGISIVYSDSGRWRGSPPGT
jgi:hypothetical protein